MWIIRNLRCHYLQNTITNSEKIFDTNSINHFTNIAKVLRGGVSELIGNYEYLRILPQPSEVKTFGMVMIRNCFTNVIKVFKGGVSYQTGKYEYLHILPQPGEVKNFGMATIRNCLFGMKLRSKYFRKEYILSKNYRAELVGLFSSTPVSINDVTKPFPSVFSPMSCPSCTRMEFTAPIIFAAGESSSRNGMTAILCGIVRFSPLMPMARIPAIASFKFSFSTFMVMYL